MKTVDLPKISYRQQEIIRLLYQHRFLTRKHIQTFLKQKDKKNTYLWLKDLRAKGYIDWIYNKASFIDKSTPAIYYLAKNGMNHYRYVVAYPDGVEIRKRYKDKDRSKSFIDRCLLIADVNLALEMYDETDKKHVRTTFYCETEADYLGSGFYHFLVDSEMIRPSLCFKKVQEDGFDEPETLKSYLLEIFDADLPQYRVRYRLKQYVTYMDEELGVWEDETSSDPAPTIFLVCSNVSDLIYAKRRMRGLISEIWYKNDEDRPSIWFTTTEKLKEHGIFGESIWERA